MQIFLLDTPLPNYLYLPIGAGYVFLILFIGDTAMKVDNWNSQNESQSDPINQFFLGLAINLVIAVIGAVISLFLDTLSITTIVFLLVLSALTVWCNQKYFSLPPID